MEPLDAEAYALLLGAKLSAALNLQVVNFLTDNEVPKKILCASILDIGLYDRSLLNWQQPLKECNTQSSRLKGKQIKWLISSQSRLDKQVLLALVCIPVKRLRTLVLVMCNRHFRTFNGECFAPSLYSVYN